MTRAEFDSVLDGASPGAARAAMLDRLVTLTGTTLAREVAARYSDEGLREVLYAAHLVCARGRRPAVSG